MTETNKPKNRFQDLPDNVGDIFKQHIQLYLMDPEKAHVWDSTPVGGPGWVTTLLLTTTGRKTGKQRHVPLFYLDNGGSYLIVASKGGMENNPVWYLNLLDNPECEIRVNKLHTKARARILEGAERERAWHKVSVINEAYPRYQARTDRPIPVVLLEPIPG